MYNAKLFLCLFTLCNLILAFSRRRTLVFRACRGYLCSWTQLSDTISQHRITSASQNRSKLSYVCIEDEIGIIYLNLAQLLLVLKNGIMSAVVCGLFSPFARARVPVDDDEARLRKRLSSCHPNVRFYRSPATHCHGNHHVLDSPACWMYDIGAS